MSVDGLVEVIALTAAIYTLLPSTRRLELRLRFHRLDMVVLLTGLIAVIVLLFYDLFWFLPAWSLVPLNPNDAAFFLSTFIAIFFLVRARTLRISPGKAQAFQRLVEELYREGKFADIFQLTSKYHSDLIRVAERNYPVVKVKDRLLQIALEKFLSTQLLAAKKSVFARLGRLANKLLMKQTAALAKILPDYKSESAIILECLRQIYTSEAYVGYIASTKPYWGLELVRSHAYFRIDFFALYISSLLGNPTSIFYEEIKKADGPTGAKDQLPLLAYLVDDPKRSIELNVWKPVGDFVLNYLDKLADTPRSSDPYNLPDRTFSDTDKWKSPIFVSIIFFDLLVCRALQQGVDYHMGLFYYNHFSGKILSNYKEPEGPRHSDWANRYAYLVDEIFSRSIDWVRWFKRVPLDQLILSVQDEMLNPKSTRLVQNVVLALFRCEEQVCTSKTISSYFKESLTEMFFGIYFSMCTDAELVKCANTLLDGIRNEMSSAGRSKLRGMLEDFNKTAYFPSDVEKLREALNT